MRNPRVGKGVNKKCELQRPRRVRCSRGWPVPSPQPTTGRTHTRKYPADVVGHAARFRRALTLAHPASVSALSRRPRPPRRHHPPPRATTLPTRRPTPSPRRPRAVPAPSPSQPPCARPRAAPPSRSAALRGGALRGGARDEHGVRESNTNIHSITCLLCSCDA